MPEKTEIIDRLRSGEHAALGDLMQSYQNYVYSILSTMLRTHEAEEATQDTFIKIYKNIDQYNGNSKLTTWMYRIAYRTGLDYLKRRKNHRSLDESLNEEPFADSIEPMALSDMRNWIDRELNKLDPKDAALVRLYYLNEYSIQEVADITGISISNVKIKLFRSRKKLKSNLNQLKLTDLIN